MQYKVKTGITEAQIDQLLTYTHSDPEVEKYTSDVTRFKDKTSIGKFLSRCTKIYTLVDAKNNLFGIIWFEEKQLPGHPNFPITMGIRIYGEARGKSLAHHFMDFCFRSPHGEAGRNDRVGVWLSTSYNNTPAIRAYTRFGFKQISDPDPKGKILMVYPA